ncbi:MAG TPA: hypothetical protein VJQ47_12315 [Steroidobacteraceae bacterium]|nr:hypothetical protein [Steroidobacteraceae bacterium]
MGIVSALGAEARHFAPSGGSSGVAAVLTHGALSIVSGMGCEAAARGARTLIAQGATALTSFGMAGGLDSRLPCGVMILPHEVIHLDGRSHATTSSWRERLAATIAATSQVVEGRLLTTSHPIASVAEKAQLFDRTGAAAVDMESFAVAEVAHAHGLPFIAVRVIVDTAADSLPRSVLLAGSEGPLRIGRLLAELVRQPRDLADLFRLARRYRLASRSLASIGKADSPAYRIFSDGPPAGLS